jgi:hypothetical protein
LEFDGVSFHARKDTICFLHNRKWFLMVPSGSVVVVILQQMSKYKQKSNISQMKTKRKENTGKSLVATIVYNFFAPKLNHLKLKDFTKKKFKIPEIQNII